MRDDHLLGEVDFDHVVAESLHHRVGDVTVLLGDLHRVEILRVGGGAGECQGLDSPPTQTDQELRAGPDQPVDREQVATGVVGGETGHHRGALHPGGHDRSHLTGEHDLLDPAGLDLEHRLLEAGTPLADAVVDDHDTGRRAWNRE